MKKLLLAIAIVLVLVLVGNILVFASCEDPPTKLVWANKWPHPFHDVGGIKIFKCGCVPVDNSVSVYCKIQYQVDEQYYWTSVASNSGTDVSTCETAKSVSDGAETLAYYYSYTCNTSSSSYGAAPWLYKAF